MKTRPLFLLPFLGSVLLLLVGCRATGTPEPTAVPTAAPTAVPTAIPTAVSAATPSGPVGDPFARPEMTVQGTLEDGTPFGVTADGHAFKGFPDAPVLLFEFSDYQ